MAVVALAGLVVIPYHRCTVAKPIIKPILQTMGPVFS